MKKKIVAVTGGAGFIGSHLVERLLNENYKVKLIDNFCTGKKTNLTNFINNKNLEIHEIDILERKKLDKIFNNCKFVFHLAALADIVPSIEKPQAYYDTNVTGTFNVLEAAKKNNVEKIIYSASASCYGIENKTPFKENSIKSTEYPYALTKYLGEQLVSHWGKIYKINYASLRLFNVYGPRSRTSGAYGAVFGVFLAQKIANKPFTVVGNGRQKRDFIYVTDVVDAFYKAALSKKNNFKINIGAGKAYSINYLTSLLKGKKIFVPKRPGEPASTLADIKLAKKLIKWKPTTSFERGVEIMLKNINNWANAPLWNKKNISNATKTWFKYLS